MGKKIVITFNSEPVVGTAFDYIIQVDGLDLVYPNGQDNVTFEYQALGGGDPNKVEIHGNLSLTINSTLAFLTANYPSPGIVYQRVNNTIEVRISIDAPLVIYIASVNANLSLTTEDVSSITTVNLKYFFEYKNIVGDNYFCEIFKNNYTGDFQEINGKAIIEKASVNNHLDPIRGGGLTLKLEASTDLTLEDLYSESERDYSVKLYKNNQLVFIGYLHPDGVYQDYVKDKWEITLDCVDGLGSLSNLSFVQDNGLHFTGKMLAMDIIYQCLKRTGTLININTAVNTYYDGMDGNNPFREIYFNADRYRKTDNDTLMSCEEVLKSILDVFKACITQIDGEWYIYKPNEVHVEPYVVFDRFNTSNNFVGQKTINTNKLLGSQIDGFYPHHCTGNQKTEIKGSIGGFRLGYKYGFVSGLFPNPKLVKNGSSLSYDGWTVEDTNYLINDPIKESGFLIKNSFTFPVPGIVKSDPLALTINDIVSLRFKFSVASGNINAPYVELIMKIQAGSNYLQYFQGNPTDPIDDTINAVWDTDSGNTFSVFLSGTGEYVLPIPKVPSNSNITFEILKIHANPIGTTYISEFDLIVSETTGTTKPIEGEFHTVERKNRVSTLVKENQTVYNGDNPSVIYDGAIFQEDALTPTNLWYRTNAPAFKLPILQIAAEEELRINQKPLRIFRGDVYGFIPYLSLITINNVGKFVPIEWSYDTVTNVTSCKSLELFANELDDIEYKYSLDYGQTVKPTIK